MKESFSRIREGIDAVRNFCIRRKKHLAIFFSIALFCLFIIPSTVHALGVEDFINGGVKFLVLPLSRQLQRLALFELEFLQVVASYNGYLTSTAVNFGWLVVRDVANMGFVIILLLIAFATILGWEAYEWKKILPKMVMAAILINFSRTICGVLIDASQVVIMTFLNAISATIGGSVINSFYFASFEKFHRSVGADTGNFVANLATPGIVSAAILAFVFSAFVCIMLFLYAGILLMRVIRLWVLIVLSPLAFIFSILPSTQGYAKQWWDELADDLITGPVIIFFMWLALTIVGSGQINQELLNSSDSPRREELKEAFQNESAGVTDVLGWNNLANMMIGIGILMVGIRVSGQIGGTSGSIMSSALTWGKKVATIATGYAAGRWLYEKGVGVAKETPGAIYRATVGKPIARSIDMLKSKVAIAGTLGRFGTVQRNKRAKELEDRGGGWNKFKAWLIESGDRKDKMVKDYQDAAEKAKYIDEENFSTSGLGGGKLKLNLGEVARSHEDVANAKKTEKLQGERNRQNELTEAMAANLENEESVFDDADKKYAAAKKRHEENQTPATRQALRDAERERDRAKAEYDQKRKAYSLEELLAYDTRKVALASTVKGEKISDKVREEERRDLAVEKEKSLSDEEIKKLSAKADTAAARADILEKNVNAKQELEKIKILKDIKKGFNRSKEEERIRAEEEAKIISEGLKISEEKMAAEMEKDLRLGEQRGLAQENARARADVDILRQNVETQKKQLALEQQQQARSIYRSPENRQTLEENAAMTAKINALSENISVDQRLLETNAASVFAQSGGQTLLDDTRRKKGELGVVEAEEKSRESLRMVQASIEALETFKDSWERANRMDMESQIHKTNYDTKMDEIRTEQAHQLQINPGTLRTLEDETRERRSRIDQMKESISTRQLLEQIVKNQTHADSPEGQRLSEQVNKEKAAAEELQVKLNRAKEVKLATERDNLRIRDGQAPVHVKSVRTKHFLEDQKTYQNISYDQMMIIEDQLNQRTKELQEEMKSGQLSIDKQSLLKNLEEQRAEILAFVTSQGGEYMRYGTERLFKEVENVAKNVKINGNDFSDEESMRSIETLQAQVLSAALHDTVEATRDGVEKGLERLKKQWGDQFTARMGILVNNLESSAGDGARNFAGLFKVHADNGEEDYRAVDLRDNKKRSKDLDHLRNKRSEALAKHSPGKLVTIGNSVSRGVVGKKGDSDYVEDGLLFETAADHEVLEKTFSRLNGNTISTVNLKLINDLNTGFKNTIKKYGKDSPEVINAINAIVSKSNNADAMLALLNNTEVLRGQLELVKNPSGGTNRSKLAQFKKT